MSENALASIKALSLEIPAFKSAVVEAAEDTPADPEPNQPAPVAVEITEPERQPEPVAQNDAQAAEPETEPKPDDTEDEQLLEVLGEQSNGTPVGKKNNQKDKLKWNRPNRVYNRNSTKPPKKPKGRK